MTNPDRLVFDQMMMSAEAQAEVSKVHQMLDVAIRQSKFNRERAEEMFLFVVDNCAYQFFKEIPGGAAVLFPKEIRKTFAGDLAQEFIHSRNDIQSQRPTRTGVLRHILGK